MRERLQKLIAAAGLCSRRRAEEWIAQGKVTVNGGLARLGDSADPETDAILVDGAPLPAAPAQAATVLLYKPRGVVTTLSDEKGRPTVAELLPPELGRLYPVGRLDLFSEGLLLMTSDGALAHRLTHPAGEVRKTYLLWVSGWTDAALGLLRRPIVLDGYRIRPPEVRLIWVHEAAGGRQQAAEKAFPLRERCPSAQTGADIEKAFPLRGRCPSAHTGADEVLSQQAPVSDQPASDHSATSSVSRLAGDGGCHLPLKGKAETTAYCSAASSVSRPAGDGGCHLPLKGKAGTTALLEITIHEGRNRQIRRMAQAAGLTPTRLKRIAEGPIRLGDLEPGQWRVLTEAELRLL